MKEEAVSPVVDFMLLLMIIVSFISILNAYYIPSLKQQAEIEHLNQVEKAFFLIDSDIHRLISFKENAVIKHRVPLGGGDVIFSPIRSSGTLRISDDSVLGTISLINDTGKKDFPITTINISYNPIGNYWINQGYEWKNGTINITKGRKSTWLEYLDLNVANQKKCEFFTILSTPLIQEVNSSRFSENNENIIITVCNISFVPDNSFISSNGIGGVQLNMTNEREFIPNVTKIEYKSNLPPDECPVSFDYNFGNANISLIKKVIKIEIIQ